MSQNVSDIIVHGTVFDGTWHMPISTANVCIIDPADSSVVATSTSGGRIQYGERIEYTGEYFLGNLSRRNLYSQGLE